MKTNTKATALHTERLAGGGGGQAAKPGSAKEQARRLVMACLLGENLAYASGGDVKTQIAAILPQLSGAEAFEIAVEAKDKQKLRHVPLFIAMEMLKNPAQRPMVSELLGKILRRADELSETLAMHWKQSGKKTIPAQLKRGLAKAFTRFDEYQLAKYNRANEVKLRDVMFLTHPKPTTPAMEALWKKLAANELETPNTWEVRLSAAGNNEEARRGVWTSLMSEKMLLPSATLKNLRNMTQAGVPQHVVKNYLRGLNTNLILPINILLAQKEAPEYTAELEQLFLNLFQGKQQLPGHTVFVVDVSGSMSCAISSKSTASRMDVGASLAAIAREKCESVSIYATGGNDGALGHKTKLIPAYHSFALINAIKEAPRELGCGGIFTRQCLEWIRTQETGPVDRIIVFSDSQDCDRTRVVPAPFGKKNYIIDVSSHQLGINFPGTWTAEISGHSENFLEYILREENVEIELGEEEAA